MTSSPTTLFTENINNLHQNFRQSMDKTSLAVRRSSALTISTRFDSAGQNPMPSSKVASAEDSPLWPLQSPHVSALEIDWNKIESPQKLDSPLKLESPSKYESNWSGVIDDKIHQEIKDEPILFTPHGSLTSIQSVSQIPFNPLFNPTQHAQQFFGTDESESPQEIHYHPNMLLDNTSVPSSNVVPIPNVPTMFSPVAPYLASVPPKIQDSSTIRLPDGSLAQLPSHLEPGNTIVLVPDGEVAENHQGPMYIPWTSPEGKHYLVTATPQGYATTTGGTVDAGILLKSTGSLPHISSSRSQSPASSDGPTKKKKKNPDTNFVMGATGTHTPSGKVKPFACHVCPQTFSRSHDLKRHLCKHTGVRPFACELCGKSFSRRDGLTRHTTGDQCPARGKKGKGGSKKKDEDFESD